MYSSGKWQLQQETASAQRVQNETFTSLTDSLCTSELIKTTKSSDVKMPDGIQASLD
jgi:hypothetical protein